MTREEAIEKVDGLEPFDIPTRRGQSVLLVDKLVALGVLKLDEPSPRAAMAPQRFYDLCWDERLPANHIVKLMDAAGLKVIEK